MGTKRLSLGTNRLGTKEPWVRNDWIPIHADAAKEYIFFYEVAIDECILPYNKLICPTTF